MAASAPFSVASNWISAMPRWKAKKRVMDINVIFGGVEIRVPDHWRVEARNQTLFGGYTDTTRGTGNPSGQRHRHQETLVITGQVLFGGIEVKN